MGSCGHWRKNRVGQVAHVTFAQLRWCTLGQWCAAGDIHALEPVGLLAHPPSSACPPHVALQSEREQAPSVSVCSSVNVCV